MPRGYKPGEISRFYGVDGCGHYNAFPQFPQLHEEPLFEPLFLYQLHEHLLVFSQNYSNMSESVGNEESYVTKEDQVPVVDDNDNVEEGVDETTADSDAQLGISHY